MEDAFAIVLPYYNEAAYLRATVASLLEQSLVARQLILVDNGSTDSSAALCRQLTAGLRETEVLHLSEQRPGKIFALELACRYVRTPLVAFVDADTFYPPHYLATAARLFRAGGPRRVAVMAKDLTERPDSPGSLWKRWFYSLLSRVLYWQTFAGGCGQTFRTEAFRAAGAYSVARWKYTLEDHELMNRLRRFGSSCYHPQMWCLTSTRRRDRTHVGWNWFEQLVYLCAPPQAGDWFFQRFLARRFDARQIYQSNLREQRWHDQDEPIMPLSKAA